MNREQAEHILDAYVNLECSGGDNKARLSLREVILDAMTSYKVATAPSISWPNTYPLEVPNVIHNKPIVTCDAGGEYHIGYRCSICGDDYWSTNETTAYIKRKEHKDGMLTTKIWEFCICDKCLKKLVVGE